jgi:8-oxo-dGTP pyrophosphatase MutT (NUDIX family)
MDDLSWKTGRREKLLDCRIFDVYQVERSAKDGRSGKFIQIDAPDWVTVLPVIRDKFGHLCFLMVRQYRHGSSTVTLEFPAGTVESDEPAKEAAYRELLEETGCRPARLIKIGEVSPNPAFLSNTVTFFVAEELELIQQQHLDEHEMIDIELVPVNEVIHSMGTGVYNNAIMVSALCYYLRWRGLVHDIED